MENNPRKKKRRNKTKIILISVLLTLVVLVGIAAGAYFYVNDKIHQNTDTTDIFENPEDKARANEDEEKGLINILLVGVDARPGEKTGRTDSMILATIDTNSKRVKLTSFMRDMYVEIPGYKNNKINAAFASGGPELLIKTINHNFNISIQYFASINFNGFQDVVDKLGGVNIEVKDYEVKEINKYIYEVNGSSATLLKGPGFQQLNGQQALSYSRIRKVGNSDYERTERQRRVLSALMEKAKKTSLLKLPDLVTTILPYIKTNIPTPRLISLAKTVYNFGNNPTDTLRIPGDRMFQSASIQGVGDSLVPDLEKNIALLEQFIYSSGGSTAGNMPVYMANNFHASDISLDKRGKKKPVVKIEVPKPDPNLPQTPQEGEDLAAPTPPVINLDKKDNIVTVTINGSTDKVGVTGYEYSYDNKAWTAYTKPLQVTENRVIYARARDEAGNISPVSKKEIKVEVEKPSLQAPVIEVDPEVPSNGKYDKGPVKIKVINKNPSESNSYIEYLIDNGEWKKYTGVIEVSSSCTIKARTAAKDSSGTVVTSVEVSQKIIIESTSTTTP